MNKEYKEMRKQVSGMLLLLLKNMEVGGGMFPAAKIPDIRNIGRLPKWAGDILALETDTCRIAVVKKEPELPTNPIDTRYTVTSEKRFIYGQAQKDMIYMNFVEEVII